MAVPKRKIPRSKSRSRRAANWRLGAPPRSVCPNCGSAKLPHVVCGTCGWYRGRRVIEVE
jgi:large subunit ribosomal protein L32